MDEESIFQFNNYSVYKRSNDAPEWFDNGQSINYDVVNLDTDVTEMSVSTFVQAANMCVSLSEAEDKLSAHLESIKEDMEPINEDSAPEALH